MISRQVGLPTMIGLIQRKQSGGAHPEEELRYLCRGVARGSLPDYQVAAWLMATWFNGLDEAETLALTQEMVRTGDTLDWQGIGRPVVDKHSTGGVGDKTSIILVPLLAAASLAFAKMSGRGLGHTGGTIDKLEAIPGYRVDLAGEALRQQVERIGCALVGQSARLVPADGALYALRDATATVESIPLIASSVMAKKLAAGAGAIVLDVKYGTGALVRDVAQARELARTMVQIGTGAGRRVRAVLTAMDEPLGRSIGNAVEIEEAIEVLRGEGPEDLWALTRELGVHLLQMTGVETDLVAARARLGALRTGGEALRTLQRLIEAQGGDPSVVEPGAGLPAAPVIRPVRADRAGWVASVDARRIAGVVLRLGGGRRSKGERIDARVGLRRLVKVGEEVGTGEVIAEVHAASEADAEAAALELTNIVRISDTPVAKPFPEQPEVIGT